MRIGFDNDKYISLQAERIRERINQFGGKLYLEFGGKLFDDYHASRVLPGFEPDTKIRMLQSMVDDVEIIIAINANDIEKSKVRGDLGITYDEDVLRLMDIFRGMGLNYSGHILRHTFITNCYELGFPPYMVKRWVGHARVEQADVYLALRKPSEFVETEIVAYMRLLKRLTVLEPR